ncbi:MAG: hypothetical protein PVH61_00240 [Candidatus Aminicenantes bacterium]|jgi:hypothetical protein
MGIKCKEVKGCLKKIPLFVFVCLFFFSFLYNENSLDHYLHKNAQLGGGISKDIINSSGVKPLSPRQAAFFAVQRLKEKGITKILVCESHWITAPISGYLVDCQGKMTIKNKDFTVFRIGIRDGLEAHHGKKYQAGTEFVFIALGWDQTGEPVWYPEPGPDYQLKEGEIFPEELLSYEFLVRRDKFESLPTRYK